MAKIVTVLVLLIAATTAAGAAEMPKELRGKWCFASQNADGSYKPCKSGDDLIIERKFIHEIEASCTVLRVRKSRIAGSWIVKEHCPASDSTAERTSTTRYTRRGVYLYVKQL